jgi:hypothetical protein
MSSPLDTWRIGRSGELAPGIEVWTDYLPPTKFGYGGYFETLVVDHTDTRPTSRFRYQEHTTSVWDAIENHAWVTTQLRQFLADQEMV